MGEDRDRIEAVAKSIVDSLIKVHRELGPGLLESTYQACLAYELRTRGLRVEREVALPVHYGDVLIEAGYRIDMVVENIILIENKSRQGLLPIHEAQLLTYLKLSGRKLGFLINWNVALIKNGVRRMVNNL